MTQKMDTQRYIINGVISKTSPNEFFTSKMALYSFVGNVFVSYVKANVTGEK